MTQVDVDNACSRVAPVELNSGRGLLKGIIAVIWFSKMFQNITMCEALS